MEIDLNILLAIFIWFGGSGTIASLVALIVDILKRFKIVHDGDAGQVAAGINLFGLVVFSVYFFLNPAFDFASMDAVLRTVLAIIQIVLGFVLQLKMSPAVHDLGYLAKLPLLGYSLTAAKSRGKI